MNEVSNQEFLARWSTCIFDEEIPVIVHLWQCTATVAWEEKL
mgnify:CR=1 FL=1